MAIYHLTVGFISRSTGRSAVQSAAYITGNKLSETRRELTADYRNRGGDVAYTNTLVPDHAPAWAKDLHQIWDRLETFEDVYADTHYKTPETRENHKKCAQTAMTIVAALPREVSLEVARELVEEFAQTRFVSRGLVVTYAIHQDEGNPHVHLLISRRRIDEKGDFSWVKDRDICKKSALRMTRTLWADVTNTYLQREGFEERITEKSFADLGIMFLPTNHRGWMADKLEGKGVQSRIVFENWEIIQENREHLLENPASILEELTKTKATFTQADLLRTLQKRLGDDDASVAHIFEGALQLAIVVGEGMDRPDVRGDIRYTSQSYLEKEQQAVALSQQLANQTYQQKIPARQIEKALENVSVSLNEEQKQAVRGLLRNQQLAVLVGWAGTGKTTALKVVSEVYQQTGHTVIGMSLAATAAEELGTKAEINARTLDSWLYRWRSYEEAQERFLSFNAIVSEGVLKQLQWYQDLKRYERSALTDKHILLVDEAGMIGTHKWAELQRYAVKAGAKVIAIGDDSQCNPIDAGDFFRELINQSREVGSFYQLKDIRRQVIPWMREASVQLAKLNSQEGLSSYEKQGHLHPLDAETLAIRMAQDYVTRIKQGREGAVLASTHKQVALLNEAIRQELKQQGLIAQDDAFTLHGRTFSIVDRLMFLKNDNEGVISVTNNWGVTSQDAPSIKNGRQGVIREVKPFFDNTPENYAKQKAAKKTSLDDPRVSDTAQPKSWWVKVEVADNRFAWFHTDQYDHITHAYTLTLQKAQGKTMDFVLVHLSKYMDAMATYVGLTRHKEDIQLYYDQGEFKTFKALGSYLSRLDYKDLVKDYTILPENEAAHQRVQAYKESVMDTASVLADGSQNGQVDWALYHDLKSHQKQLGREILESFAHHKVYVEQAGLTKEMLEISTGLKARPLSRTEEMAFHRVALYCETAQEARTVWNTLKGTSSGQRYTNHEQYGVFQSLRDQRDGLAREIMANEPLHRDFIKRIGERLGYGKRVLQKQAAAHQVRQDDTGIIEESNNPINKYNPSYGKYSGNTKEVHDTINPNNGTQTAVAKQQKPFSQSIINFENAEKLTKTHTETYGAKSQHQKSVRQKTGEPRVEAALIKEQLTHKIKDLAFELLGKPTTQTAKEWRYGNKGSISIQVAGTKQGLYSNFEEGTSGKAMKLIQEHFGLDYKGAFKWAAEWLGNSDSLSHAATKVRTSSLTDKRRREDQKWQPLFPAPEKAPDLKAEKQLAYMVRGRQEVARFAYKDADENILGYVVRLEDRQGTKITPTLTYCRNEKGEQHWRWQGFGDDRPLYGLDQLAQKPEARVLVVEGEKTAEAAKALFPDYAVVTWSGGCGSVHKSDWSVLKDREVILWPDNDKAGHNAVAKIDEHLTKFNCKIWHLEPDTWNLLPPKWDLADPLPKGLEKGDLYQWLSPTQPFVHREDPTVILSKFCYAEIEKTCTRFSVGYLLTPESAPFLERVAKVSYETAQSWHHYVGKPCSEEALREQGHLISFYTTWAKRHLEREHPGQDHLEKAWDVGVIAATLKRVGLSYGQEVHLLLDALNRQAGHQQFSDQQEKDPLPQHQGLEDSLRTALTRESLRCGAYTTQLMNPQQEREFIDRVIKILALDKENEKLTSQDGFSAAFSLARDKEKAITQRSFFLHTEKVHYQTALIQQTNQQVQEALNLQQFQLQKEHLFRGVER